MTDQEKLNELKDSILGSGYQCHIETYIAAIEALEKQIPKKGSAESIFDEYIGANYLSRRCPKCRMEINISNPIYCNYCGQRVDFDK